MRTNEENTDKKWSSSRVTNCDGRIVDWQSSRGEMLTDEAILNSEYVAEKALVICKSLPAFHLSGIPIQS